MLGPSLVHVTDCQPAVDYILKRACPPLARSIQPVGSHPSTVVIPVGVERGELVAVLSPGSAARDGKPVRLAMAPGEYLDLWTGESLTAAADSELSLTAPDGIALLWREATSSR
jgi:hypothetical protein